MRITAWTLGLAALLAACGPRVAPADQTGEAQAPRPSKSLTIGITSTVHAMSIAGNPTTVGGWQAVAELHSNGLMTTDDSSLKSVERLAEQAPSLDDGSISLLPDGRMRVIYRLRTNATWHDGAALTAKDLVFAFQMANDRGLPVMDRRSLNEIESVDGPDDFTVVVDFKGPYYLADSLTLRSFWPQPRHLLQEAFDRYQASKDANDVLNLPYWTSDYVHTGPFRLKEFDLGEGLVFEAYERYYLGRPKLNIIRVRTFGDPNALFTNLLSGTVELFPEPTLPAELGFQIKDRWERSGEGTVYVVRGTTWFVTPQWRPAIQTEPTNFDPKVRAAFYHAIDRDALSEGLRLGPPAYSLITPGYRNHEASKDDLLPYKYNPDRARALLREAGWTPGTDGILRNAADGRPFRTSLTTTPGNEISAIADYWQRVGVEVEQITLSASQSRDSQVRASYPGWEASGNAPGDGVLNRLLGPAASAATRWSGNRGGYEDPRAEHLIRTYYRSVGEQEQLRNMKAISEFVAAELPILPLYYNDRHTGVRKHVRALEDVHWREDVGGDARNAHTWDI